MIHVDRPANPPEIGVYVKKTVKALDGVTKVTKFEQELEKATVFFTDPAHYAGDKKRTKKKFTFTVFKDHDLVDELEKIFRGKCAYCESRFAHVTPKDIEHYRPKSAIDTGQAEVKPGYWWLGGEWANLLVSCPDCNRSRKHEVPGQAARVKLGKTTQFPLATEASRVRDHQQDAVAIEEPARLLLHPCIDQP